MTTPHYAHVDTRKPDGFYIHFERVDIPDDSINSPDAHDEGFWPSPDPKAAGYVRPENYDSEMAKAEARMIAWRREEWGYIGVRARAHCLVVGHGVGTMFTLDSPGVWGVESDAGDYLNDLFEEQKTELLDMIAAMRNPIIEA